MVRLLHVGILSVGEDSLLQNVQSMAADVELVHARDAKEALEFASENDFDCILCDIDTGHQDGLQLLGAIRERGIPTPFIILIEPGQEDVAAEAMRSGADDYFVIGKSKIFAELLLNSIVRRISAARDRVQRAEIELALRKSEERYRTVAEFTTEWVCWISSTQELLYISPSCERVTGYSEDDFFNNPGLFTSIIHPDDQARFADHNETSEKSGEDSALEFRIIRADGEVRWISHRCRPIRGADGSLLGRRGSNRDITELKQTEEELRQSRNSLKQQAELLAETNRELESFIYTVSHDFQAPLRRINSWVKLLLADHAGELDSECQDYLGRIDETSQELRRLFGVLLKFSRSIRSEINREKVNLSAIAKMIAARLRDEDPGRKVEFVIENEVEADGDQSLLLIVMENLFGNAWKFTSKKEQARIEFGVKKEGDGTVFIMRDNGVGFDQAKSNRMFDAFHRLHNEKDFEGLGVGLASVKRIVHRHGGRIWAEGHEGQGATFYFTLS